MTELDRIAALRAFEALRNGVPNRHAVHALGCMQPAALDAFQDGLGRLQQPDEPPPLVDGVLIAGGFGTGKSHTLSYLEQQALERNFVVSRVVVSKETPLYDPAKLFLAAVREAKLPKSRGALLDELALRLDYRSSNAASFVAWAKSEQPHGIVGATVAIHERSHDAELLQQIVDYWAGEKLAVQAIRNGLRNLDLAKAFDVKAVRLEDLAPVRFEFTARLARAVGFSGWVILIDEVELIARYSLLQRAKSYGSLARCFGVLPSQGVRGALFVAAITDDFALEVLEQRRDREKVQVKLTERGDTRSLTIAAMASAGMDLIQKRAIHLTPPSDDSLYASYQRLQRLYGVAYGREPSGAFEPERGAHRPMRSYVRRWVWGWDLERIDPSTRPEPEEEEVKIDYDEDADLASAASQESEEAG